MMNRFFVFFIFITAFVSAQSSGELFDKANSLYQKGKYEEAISTYNRILNKGELSSELYHNIGNCFFKLNSVAPSIYSYEKAILLDNSNKEAQNNLVLANLLKVDRIVKVPNTFWENFEVAVFQKLSFENWGLFAVLFSFLSAAFFLFYYFALSSSSKRLFFVTCFLNLLFTIVSYLIALHQYINVANTDCAIIYAKELKVKMEPVSGSNDVIILHEGEKVKVIDSIDNWSEIKIVNGQTGWALSSGLKSL